MRQSTRWLECRDETEVPVEGAGLRRSASCVLYPGRGLEIPEGRGVGGGGTPETGRGYWGILFEGRRGVGGLTLQRPAWGIGEDGKGWDRA